MKKFISQTCKWYLLAVIIGLSSSIYSQINIDGYSINPKAGIGAFWGVKQGELIERGRGLFPDNTYE